ncbi:MAG: hypothetical protein EOP87_11785 [Verrucomicrobiaceae bacterium]|nr:MAG: hypothetical protein EOP87_11785 [Verrucomicrobiaceae bacterium]
MKNTSPRGFFVLLALLFSWITMVSAQAQVNTYFTDKHGTFNGLGSYWYQQFTVSQKQTFVLRVTSDYSADAAIITGDQLGNFTGNRSFSGYAMFDNQYGTKGITLAPGTYYVAIRSQSTATNAYRLELDLDIALPAESGLTYTFVDHYLQGTEYVGANGGKLWHGFTIQSGFRYFVDGCNTGLSTYVIPASELSAFKSGGTFNYYTAYSATDNAYPGLDEIKLPPGSYYLAFTNTNTIQKPVTYTMERWRVNKASTVTLDMSGTASWTAKGSTVDIRIAKISNLGTAKSGSLRLRLWAVKSKYTGGSISGYVLGQRSLDTLSGGYSYKNIKGKVTYKKPPSGKYYSVLTLEEYTKAGWKIRDYVSFKEINKL